MNAPDRNLPRPLGASDDASPADGPATARQVGWPPVAVAGGLAGAALAPLLEALFERAPMGLALLDLDTRTIVAGNPALCALTGACAPERLGRWPANVVPPARRPEVERWYDSLRQAGEPLPLDLELTHPQGHTLQLQLAGVPLEPGTAQGMHLAWLLVKDLSTRRALERQLVEVATRDRLTGLPNRVAMMTHLQASLDRCHVDASQGFATLFLDFDRFKHVNDTLGHAVGDDLLRAIGQRLLTALPAEPGWMCARFGGDEFVVVAPGLLETAPAVALAQHLLAACAPAHRIGSHELHASASIGVAMAGITTPDAESLLREADTAMYEAKRRGRDQVVVFDESMHTRLSRTVTIESGLRRAIERHELTLLYQPIVELDSGRMTGAEALMRWTHRRLGPVSPVEFIPIAEDAGHIVALGLWAMREACAQWQRWQAEDRVRAPARVSVNLSRVQMALGSALVEQVRQVLAETGVPAEALQLEVTEREVMTDPAAVIAVMTGLRGLGVSLALDDFGTGVSSLGCLRDFPLDVIKIDKSFMADLCRDSQAMAVAHATIAVIENLGLRSVAEGVEKHSDVAVLQALGCQYGQGYLFGKPMPGDRLIGAMSRGFGDSD